MKTTHTSRQLQNFLTLLEQKRVTPERFQLVLGSGVLADIFDSEADLSDRPSWRRAMGLGSLELRITVNYDRTLAEMIAAGHYDWVNNHITAKNFPLSVRGKVELVAELIHFNHNILSEKAVIALDKRSLRPGTIEELLAFGETFPDIQRKFPIIALGSSCEVSGDRRVACLSRCGAEWYLYLGWWDGGWVDDCRFLAFRK